jgi:type IV pilus assembly protein PilC
MPRYLYHVRDAHGDLATGVLAAPTLEHAGRLLRGDGKFVVKLSEAADERAAAQKTPAPAVPGRVRRAEVIYFANQMAIMMETGVPIVEALESMAEQTANARFKAVLDDVTEHVKTGHEFSAALQRHPKVFPDIMISLIRAGEFSGTMSRMLERICEYMAKEQRIFRQARGALMYPCFMGLMAVSVVVFLLAVILPQFKSLYADRGAALPGPTRLLLGMSDGIVDYWFAWVALAVAVVLAFTFGGRTRFGRRFFDWCKLHLPLLRFLYTQLYVTRACRTLGTMTNAGISMLDTVEIMRHVTNNSYYDDLWDTVDDSLRQGAQLSEPLFRSSLVPRPVSQMIRSGERSGRIAEVSAKVADFAEAEFDQTVKTTTQMIEPLMIVVMGSVIGFVAIALLLPIFTISKVMSG